MHLFSNPTSKPPWGSARYFQNQYQKKGKAKKDKQYHEGGGKEKKRKQYHEGGGKEKARQRYEKKKKDLMEDDDAGLRESLKRKESYWGSAQFDERFPGVRVNCSGDVKERFLITPDMLADFKEKKMARAESKDAPNTDQEGKRARSESEDDPNTDHEIEPQDEKEF
jgi:hypothetical protein